MLGKTSLTVIVFISSFLLSFGAIFFATSPTFAKTTSQDVIVLPKEEIALYKGKHVIVHTREMRIVLKEGTTTLESFPILSVGKPGSYYETIGGVYENDYKTPLHFSSIGHVYMPYSIHVFGNYFIHGVPYYADGTRVSTAYSGGCIRLEDLYAKKVYDFIEKGTPIIITQGKDTDFLPTEYSSSTIVNMDMTTLMVATISLEVLTQDNLILGVDNTEYTTRKKLLPILLNEQDSRVTEKYIEALGEKTFVDLMNQKAKSLGLSNTTFKDALSPVTTTYDDYMRFMAYITTFKSYLRTVQEDTNTAQ
jgi:hypothetical protein